MARLRPSPGAAHSRSQDMLTKMKTSNSAADHAARSATIRAALLILVGALGVQGSAAIATTLFEPLGVLQTSTVRLILAAIVLLAIFRPRLRGRTRREWAGIVLYGVAMALMNIFVFLSISKIPLGIAMTINFLGPCMVALLGSRRIREVLLALTALGGVVLIAGLGGPFDPLGLFYAGLSAASFGLYTLLAANVGQSAGGLPSVALSATVAAILTLPFSVPVIPVVTAPQWGILLISALLGTTLVFTVDTLAGRLTSARVIGVLFSLDPAVATMIGAIFLGQSLSIPTLAGIALVVASGAGIVWFAGRSAR